MNLGTHMSDGERRNPIDIEVCRSKVKVTLSIHMFATRFRTFCALLIFTSNFIVYYFSNFSFNYFRGPIVVMINFIWKYQILKFIRSFFILCNRCLSPLTLWVWILLMARCTQYNFVINFFSDLRQDGGLHG